MIEKAQLQDINQIVGLHYEAFSDFFSVKLGAKYLKFFYSVILGSNATACFVDKDSGEILGFITGAIDKKRIFSLSDKLTVLFFILRAFFTLKISLGEIVDFLRYLRWDKKRGCKVELLALAVKDKNRSKGIGSRLLEVLIKHYKLLGINEFTVFSSDLAISAMAFYGKNRFIINDTIRQKRYNIICLVRKI